MGTHTQSVMDRATFDTERAKRLGECIVAWLVEQEIIQHRLTDCCYKPGYPPGPHYRRACLGIAESEGEADYADFLEYNSNGMELSTTRNAFFNGQGDYGPARWPPWAAERDIHLCYAAADVWVKEGEGELACMQCGQTAPVTA